MAAESGNNFRQFSMADVFLTRVRRDAPIQKACHATFPGQKYRRSNKIAVEMCRLRRPALLA
jgi:hypothetical protein